jgi:hypothetical protein
MRLETPVTYIHPPLHTSGVLELDIKAEFRGGLLTEYYPYAMTSVDGETTTGAPDNDRITSSTRGAIQWKGVRIGDQADPLPTDSHVWTAPRAVGSAATLKVYKPGPPGSQPDDEGTTEGEVYLFYRAVGHLQSPVAVNRSADSLAISIRKQTAPFVVNAAWLIDVRQDGTSAFRHLGQLDAASTQSITTVSSFDPVQYTPKSADDLRSQMREALNAEGLFDDEAAAMLNTWERSYFQSPGMRLFYIVPQTWTDNVLPLTVVGPARVEHRVMMGRIEIVTAAQRELLRKISTSKPADVYSVHAQYEALGRFANALLLDENARRPTPGLSAFISAFHLESGFPLH